MKNIFDLVQTLTDRINELDGEDAEAIAAGSNSASAREAAEERNEKRIQLQILKDNVTVLSRNLESLVSRSMETGTSDFDLDAVETVINETAAMLEMLNSDDENYGSYDPDAPAPSNQIDPSIHLSQLDEIIDGVEWMAMEDHIFTETFGLLDLISDISFTPDNFNALDPSKRPSNWAELRRKRVMVREHVERLEGGVTEDELKDQRNQRLAQVCLLP